MLYMFNVKYCGTILPGHEKKNNLKVEHKNKPFRHSLVLSQDPSKHLVHGFSVIPNNNAGP